MANDDPRPFLVQKNNKISSQRVEKDFSGCLRYQFHAKDEKETFVNRLGRQLFVYQFERRIVKFPISHKVTKGIELFEHLEQFFTISVRGSLEAAAKDDNLTNSTANRADGDQETEKRSK